jgi:hypothetical protein
MTDALVREALCFNRSLRSVTGGFPSRAVYGVIIGGFVILAPLGGRFFPDLGLVLVARPKPVLRFDLRSLQYPAHWPRHIF